MLRLSELNIVESREALRLIPEGKVLINTINAHSFNVAQKDELFAEALRTGFEPPLTPPLRKEGTTNGGDSLRKEGTTNGGDSLRKEGTTNGGDPLREEGTTKGGDSLREEGTTNVCVKYLIPDGASIIKACKLLKAKTQPKERIAGWDLFAFEMRKLNDKGKMINDKLRVMFMGSSEKVLARIREKAAVDYPNLEVVTYSPPYKPEFSEEDNAAIIKAINDANPDLLWIGMTAPKQEKWTYSHWQELNIHCHVGTIGAVFDFYAGTAQRAPEWWQEHSLEWLYRLVKEPKRMWRRYVIGNPLFLWNIGKEKV